MNCPSDSVLVDREALERVLCVFPENPPVRGLGGLPRDLAQAIKTARAALALPAQAAADAAGVLRQVAEYREAEDAASKAQAAQDALIAERTRGLSADELTREMFYRTPEYTAAMNQVGLLFEQLNTLDAARLRALADALEVK